MTYPLSGPSPSVKTPRPGLSTSFFLVFVFATMRKTPNAASHSVVVVTKIKSDECDELENGQEDQGNMHIQGVGRHTELV
jgi:hypothetical protein